MRPERCAGGVKPRWDPQRPLKAAKAALDPADRSLPILARVRERTLSPDGEHVVLQFDVEVLRAERFSARSPGTSMYTVTPSTP